MSDIALAIDVKSFPKKCRGLEGLLSIVSDDVSIVEIPTESPREYLKRCEELAESFDLVIPVTRNMFIRDHLANRGVDIILTA